MNKKRDCDVLLIIAALGLIATTLQCVMIYDLTTRLRATEDVVALLKERAKPMPVPVTGTLRVEPSKVLTWTPPAATTPWRQVESPEPQSFTK